jgi:hypothetical protein
MWVDRDDVRINDQIIGDGPTVVLQTGGAGDGGMWQEHLRYLSDFRVVLLDHRGRGASSRPSGLTAHSMSHYVEDVVAVIKASSTEPVECATLLVAGALEDPSYLNESAATKMPRAQGQWLPGHGHVGAFLAAREQCKLIVPHLRASL